MRCTTTCCHSNCEFVAYWRSIQNFKKIIDFVNFWWLGMPMLIHKKAQHTTYTTHTHPSLYFVPNACIFILNQTWHRFHILYRPLQPIYSILAKSLQHGCKMCNMWTNNKLLWRLHSSMKTTCDPSPCPRERSSAMAPMHANIGSGFLWRRCFGEPVVVTKDTLMVSEHN